LRPLKGQMGTLALEFTLVLDWVDRHKNRNANTYIPRKIAELDNFKKSYADKLFSGYAYITSQVGSRILFIFYVDNQ
jgi:hypothetical protein